MLHFLRRLFCRHEWVHETDMFGSWFKCGLCLREKGYSEYTTEPSAPTSSPQTSPHTQSPAPDQDSSPT